MKICHALFALLCAVGLQAAALAAKTIVIDVRTPQEFASGHVEGAHNIEYQHIASRIGMTGAQKGDTIVLYCRSGNRAGTALQTLRQMGYGDVRNYGSVEAARTRLQGGR